jgi:putative tryptophan/tyrosine transport system substrate-binding protein
MRRRDLLASGLAVACGSVAGCGFASGQSKPLPLVTYVSISPNPSFPAHRSALAALGWEDGRNVRLEAHSGDGQIEGLRPILEKLLRQQPDVIVASGGTVTLNTVAITRTIPIVMSASSTDPVRAGWAASYARPGGNVTGLTFGNDEAVEKQLQLLKQTAPNLTHVGILHTAGNEAIAPIAERAFRAAAALGLSRTLAHPAVWTKWKLCWTA